jgi:hypothetical protein
MGMPELTIASCFMSDMDCIEGEKEKRDGQQEKREGEKVKEEEEHTIMLSIFWMPSQ